LASDASKPAGKGPGASLAETIARAVEREHEAAAKRNADRPEDARPADHKKLWLFTRMVKGYFPDKTPAVDALRLVRGVLCELYSSPDPWPLAFPDYKEHEATFMDQWELVVYPAGVEFLEIMVRKADQRPVAISAPCASKEYPRLISLCAWLQVHKKNEPFFLSCEAAGRALGIDNNMVHRLLRLAVAERVIEVTEKGRRGRATHYILDLTRFPELWTELPDDFTPTPLTPPSPPTLPTPPTSQTAEQKADHGIQERQEVQDMQEIKRLKETERDKGRGDGETRALSDEDKADLAIYEEKKRQLAERDRAANAAKENTSAPAPDPTEPNHFCKNAKVDSAKPNEPKGLDVATKAKHQAKSLAAQFRNGRSDKQPSKATT
jgi:hypothetical protein